MPEIEIVSVDGAGNQGTQNPGNYGSVTPAISEDGRFVLFMSATDGLVAEDMDGGANPFVKDLQTGEITWLTPLAFGTAEIPVSSDGRYVAGFVDGFGPFIKDLQAGTIVLRLGAISADGRYVAYGNGPEVLRKDLQTGSITRVDVDGSGDPANGDSGSAWISSDGRYVAFTSRATNLAPGDTNNENFPGFGDDVFVKDMLTGTVVRASTDTAGGEFALSQFPSMSDDGRHIAFTANLGQLVVKDLGTGDLTVLTTNGISPESPSISADGRFVVFASLEDNLVSGDTNADADVFVKDLQTGSIALVSRNSAGAQGNFGSVGPSISADGRYIAFTSYATNLVSGDTNEAYDIFRVANPLYPTAPVTSITASGAGIDANGSGILTATAVVTLTVNFSDAVFVGGSASPFLALNNGGTASYVSGSGSTALSFVYTVETGQDIADLGVSSIVLAGGTITDSSGQNADLSGAIGFSLPGALTIDSTPPLAPVLALANDGGWYPDDGLTNSGLINVTGLEAGAAWQYSTDGGQSWTAGSGSTITLTAEGSYSVLARQTDAAGNSSATSSALAVTLDMTIGAPTITLVYDTGSSASDGITSIPFVVVTADVGTSLLISVGGSNFAFEAPWPFAFGLDSLISDGPHLIPVQSFDAAGNISSVALLSLTLDRSIATPTLALASDTGFFPDDGLTNSGLINVMGLEAGAAWQYSTDGGQSWTAGSGSTITLTDDGSYGVQVRQTDMAGNSATSSTLAVTLDRTLATPTVALVNDTGSSASDGITSDGRLVVTADIGTTVAVYVDSIFGLGFSQWPGTFETPSLAFDGSHLITVQSFDDAGNVSTSAPLIVTLDRSSAAIQSIVVSGNGIDAGGNGTLGADALVTFRVNFSEPVFVGDALALAAVAGTPFLALNNGGTAIYAGGSGSSTLTFEYTVDSGADVADLSVVSLNLNGASLADSAGNAANPSGANNFNPPGTLVIETDPSNSAPVVSGPVTLAASPEDAVRTITTAELLANASDDGASLTVENLQASSGTLTDIGGGSWTFRPAVNDDISVTFTYQVSDGSLSAAASATLDLTPVNDAPTLDIDADNSHGNYQFMVYTEDGAPVSIAGPDVRITDPDNTHLVSATVTLNGVAGDVLAYGGQALVTDTILGNFRARVIYPSGFPEEGAPLVTFVTLTPLAPSLGTLASFEEVLGGFQFASGSQAISGERLITFTLNDGESEVVAATARVSMFESNDSPDLDLDANNSSGPPNDGRSYRTTFTEGAAAVSVVDADVSITDLEGDDMSSALVRLTNAQAGDALSVNGALPGGIVADFIDAGTIRLVGIATASDYEAALRQVVFSNSSENPGTIAREIAVSVSDSRMGSNTARTTIDIAAVNDAPVAAPIDLGTLASSATRVITAAELLASVSDVDGPAATITSLSIQSGNGSLQDNGSGTWTYTPAPNDGGGVTFSYTASDGSLSASSVAVLDLTVSNRSPTVAGPLARSAFEDSGVIAINLLQGATDPDGDTLQASNVGTLPPGFTLSGNTLSVDTGAAAFQSLGAGIQTAIEVGYDVADGHGGSVHQTATVRLRGVNDTPVATNDAASIVTGSSLLVRAPVLLGNDFDVDGGDRLQIVSVQGAQNGRVQFSARTQEIRFTPDAGYTGPASFTYTVADRFGATATATVLIAVTPNLVPGTSAGETLTGTREPDLITPGAGNDRVSALAGDDILVATMGDGDDQYDGGAGADTYDLSQITGQVIVNLASGRASGPQIGTDQLNSVENVIGGSGNDRITGDRSANRIAGGGGDDVIAGDQGNDTFVATIGDGNDRYDGGAGTDTYDLTQITDPVTFSFIPRGGVTVTGAQIGTDTFVSVEQFIGSGGNDVFVAVNESGGIWDGGAGTDTLDLSQVTSPLGVDLAQGSTTGRGLLSTTLRSIENVIGTRGADRIQGDAGANTLTGGAGPDVLAGRAGDDTFVATIGDSDDSYDGGAGTDTYDLSQITAPVTVNLSGRGPIARGSQIGADTLSGIENVIAGAGDDNLTGDDNANVLSGGAGADRLVGGGGTDVLIGGLGNDSLTGNGDNDIFVFAANFGNDTISGFDFDPSGRGQDLLDISAFGITSESFDLRVEMAVVGTAVQVTIDSNANQTITLLNAQFLANITESDFILTA